MDLEHIINKANGQGRTRMVQELNQDRLIPGDLLRKHLIPCGEDIALITLKGHLIIEHMLEVLLCRLLRIPSLPNKGEGDPELEFAQKLKLVKAAAPCAALGYSLFSAIGKLNKLRNQLAHQLLDQPETLTAANAFIDSVKAKVNPRAVFGRSAAEQLRNCLYCIVQFLDLVRVELYKRDECNF